MALIGGTGALALQGQEIAASVVRRHDDGVAESLKAQITDPKSKGYGNIPQKREGVEMGFYSTGGASGLIDSFTAAYLHTGSRYHGNALLLEFTAVTA